MFCDHFETSRRGKPRRSQLSRDRRYDGSRASRLDRDINGQRARYEETYSIAAKVSRSAKRRLFTAGPVLVALIVVGAVRSSAQIDGYSKASADSIVKLPPQSSVDAGEDRTRGYAPGLLLEGMHAGWYDSANGEYFRYEQGVLDAYLESAPSRDTIDAQDS